MAKAIKIILGVIAVLVLLVVVAVGIAVATFDPNDYRKQIAALVKDKTGRDLTLGSIKLSVFPWLKVELTDVVLSNAPGFGSEPFAKISRAATGVKLMPLIRDRSIQVDDVALENLSVNLARHADGTTNWDDLIKPTDPKSPEDEKKSGFDLKDINIGGVSVKNAAIVFVDEKAGETYRVSRFDLKTGSLKPGKAFDIETSLAAALEKQKLSTELSLAAHVDPDLKKQTLDITKLKFNGSVKNPEIEATAEFTGDIAAALEAQTVKVSDLKLKATAKQGTLNATADVTGDVDAALKAQTYKISGLTLKATAKDAKQALDATADVTGDVAADLTAQKADLSKLNVKAKGKRGADSGEAELTGNVKADLAAQLFQLPNLVLKAKGKAAGYDVDANVSTNVRADLKAKLYQLAGLQLKATLGGDKILGGTSQTIQLNGDVRYDQANGTAQLSKILLQAAGLEASTDISARNLNGDVPQFSGPISVKPFNPRDLLSKFSKTQLQTADAKALTSLAFSGNVEGSSKAVNVSNLVAKLDQSSITGSAGLKDIASTAIAFALKIDSIDADRYLPPEPKEKPAAMTREQLNATAIPTDALKDLNIDGSASIGKFKIKGVNLADVSLKIVGPKGGAKNIQLGANAYGGKADINARITPNARADYALKAAFTSIAIQQLMKDFMQSDKISGTGNVNLNVTGAGATVGDLRKSLNGDLSLALRNGAVKGMNLGEALRKAQAAIKGQAYTAPAEAPETDFASIDFSGKFNNGTLHSDSLDARNPLLRVGGEGDIDLVNETLNYTVKPTIVETSKGQGGRGLEELGGLTVPVRLTGPLAAPKFKVLIEDVIKQKAKAELKNILEGQKSQLAEPLKLEEKKEELKQKINEKIADPKLNEKLNGALEGLFKKKKPAAAPEATPAPTATPQPQSAPPAP